MMKNKISAEVCGGLGNQLFIISTAIAYGIDHGKEPIFLKIGKSPSYGGARPTYWDTIFKKIKTVGKFDCQFKILKEQGFTFSALPGLDGNIMLKGYFQSWRYFHPHRDHLIRLFKQDSRQEGSVSIHVRRGDYLKLKRIYNQLDMDYYEKAMSFFPNKQFLIFSDDIPWCKKMFHGDNISFVQEGADYEQLLLMSNCCHNILSNSTFSWWGAYLNNRAGRKVVAPKKFFVNHLDSKDMYPPSWILI